VQSAQLKFTQSEKEKLLTQQLDTYKFDLTLSQQNVAKLEEKCEAKRKELNDAIKRNRQYYEALQKALI
jgi:hypothetical protein